jgi:hypothetical protein
MRKPRADDKKTPDGLPQSAAPIGHPEGDEMPPWLLAVAEGAATGANDRQGRGRS